MAKNFGGAKKSETIETHIRGGGYNEDEVPRLRGRYPDNKESEG